MLVLKQTDSIFGIYITLSSTKISSISTMQLIYQMNVKFIFCVKKMQYNPKIPKYVIAITEHGMYVYQKRTDEIEGIQLFYSWHNLENLKIEVCPEGGIYIDGKLF